MKILALALMSILTMAIMGGTLWAILGWGLLGWLKWIVGFGGLLVGTLVCLGIFWILWPRKTMDDENDSEH